MAARSEQILISIRTFGAAKARSDINKVQRATDNLNKSVVDQGAAYELNTKAMKDNFDQHQKQSSAIHGEVAEGRRAVTASNRRTRAAKEESRTYGTMTDALIASQRKRASVDKLIERGNAITEGREKKRRDTYIAGERAKTLAVTRGEAVKRTELLRTDRLRKSAERAAIRAHNADIKRTKEFAKIRSNVFKKSEGAVRGVVPNIGFRQLRLAAIVQSVVQLVPILGTALNAVGAGGIAAVNGLAPLVGVLGALPAGIAAMAQAGVVLKMAFGGDMAKALKGDAEALANMGPNAQNFANAFLKLKPVMNDIKNNVRESLFSGMGSEILAIGKIYLPFLNQELAKTATNINKAARNFTGWMQSGEGMKTNKGIAKTNSYVVGRSAEAGSRLLQTLLMVTNAAGPMIREMSDDVLAIMTRLNNWVAGNQGGIGEFFSNAYDKLKGVMGVLGDYGAGVYNIIKAAAPLTDAMGSAIAKAGQEFRDWTGSHGDEITKYFKDMQGPLTSLVHLAGAVAQGIFEISNNPQFTEVVDKITSELVPAMVNMFKNVDLGLIGKVVDLFSSALNFYSKLPSWITTGIPLVGMGIALLGPIASYFTGAAKAIMALISAIKVYRATGGGLNGIVRGGAAALGGGAVAAGAGGVGATVAGGAARGAGKYTMVGPQQIAGAGAGGLAAAGTVGATGKFGNIGPVKAGASTGLTKMTGSSYGQYGYFGKSSDRMYDKMAKNVNKYGTEKPTMRQRVGGKVGGLKAGGMGGMGGKMLGAAGAASIIIPVAGAVVGDKGEGFSGLSAGGMQSSVATGDVNRLFQNKKGGNLVGGWKTWANGGDIAAKVLGGVGKVDSSTSALNYFNKNTKGAAGVANNVFGKIGGIFGQSSGTDKVAAQFGDLDGVLSQMAASGDTAGAAKQFGQIKKQAEQVGMPMDKLIGLFPQYRGQIESTVDPMDKAGHSAKGLSDKMAEVPGGVDASIRAIMNWQNSLPDDLSLPGDAAQTSGAADAGIAPEGSPHGDNSTIVLGSGMYHGGYLSGGQSSMVGELGPEMAISRDGGMSLLGAGMFKAPSGTAIIPSSATFNPQGGNFGDAPGWAKDAYQNAAGVDRVSPSSGGGGGDTNIEYKADINITGGAGMDTAQIQQAVLATFRKMEQDRKERR